MIYYVLFNIFSSGGSPNSCPLKSLQRHGVTGDGQRHGGFIQSCFYLRWLFRPELYDVDTFPPLFVRPLQSWFLSDDDGRTADTEAGHRLSESLQIWESVIFWWINWKSLLDFWENFENMEISNVALI